MLPKEELEYLYSFTKEFEEVNFTLFDDDNYYNLSVPPWAIKLILEKEDIGGDRYE